VSERGVFAVDRGIWVHPAFESEPFTQREAWCWLVSEAAWQDRRVRVATVVVNLKRGQVSHSLRYMAGKWQWTLARVQRFLSRLKTDTMIDTSTDTGVTVITICNYSKYQRVSLPVDTATDTGPIQDRYKEKDIKDIKDIRESPRANGKSRKKAAHPLPDDWSPGSESKQKAQALGLTIAEIDRETQKFKNYARQNDRRVVLWDAAFDNWCIKAAEFLNRSPPTIKSTAASFPARPDSPRGKAWRTYWRDLNTPTARSMVRELDRRQLEGREYPFEAPWPPGHQTEAA
jgi:hypothetical protein